MGKGKITKGAVEPAPKLAVKEPWEMMRAEFIKQRKERLKEGIEYRGYFTPGQLHRRAVEGALQNKEPVPPEVLAEYIEKENHV